MKPEEARKYLNKYVDIDWEDGSARGRVSQITYNNNESIHSLVLDYGYGIDVNTPGFKVTEVPLEERFKDWADEIVRIVKYRVQKAVLDAYARNLESIKEGERGTVSDPAARTAVIVVLEEILQDFPNLNDYFNEGMREVIKQIKERGNLQ